LQQKRNYVKDLGNVQHPLVDHFAASAGDQGTGQHCDFSDRVPEDSQPVDNPQGDSKEVAIYGRRDQGKGTNGINDKCRV